MRPFVKLRLWTLVIIILNGDKPVDGVAVTLGGRVRRRSPCSGADTRRRRGHHVPGRAATARTGPAVAGELGGGVVARVGAGVQLGRRRLTMGCGRLRLLLGEVRRRRRM